MSLRQVQQKISVMMKRRENIVGRSSKTTVNLSNADIKWYHNLSDTDCFVFLFFFKISVK